MVGVLVQVVQTALPLILVLCVPAVTVGFLAAFIWSRMYKWVCPYESQVPQEQIQRVADRGYWGTIVAVGLFLTVHTLAPPPVAATAPQAQGPSATPFVPCQPVTVEMRHGQPQHVVYGPPGCGQ